ncbi:hypothetical protein [Salinisphaera sp. T31B1]
MVADDMGFHLPVCLRTSGKFAVGFSETVPVMSADARRNTANDLTRAAY